MKIGIFDSGLGGLHIASSIRKHLPQYDYLYLGDTLHVPYGRRSAETVHNLTLAAVRYLFSKDCQLIIIACNTASALALRRIQQDYLAHEFPDRRVLGVIVPTLEETLERGAHRIGLLATEAMVESGIYEEELLKINPDISLATVAAPLLVPMLEHAGDAFLDQALDLYLQPLLSQNIDALILGCTHYCLLKARIERLIGKDIDIIAQDEIVSLKLEDYLHRHNVLNDQLSKTGKFDVEITDINDSFIRAAKTILGPIELSINKSELF